MLKNLNHTTGILLTCTSFTLLMLISGVSVAQSMFTIRGEVQDSAHHAIPDAVINLVRASDTTLVKSAIGEENGSFVFENIGQDSVCIIVMAAGFEVFFSDVLVMKDETERNVGALLLQGQKQNTLKEVAIVSRIPYISRKAGMVSMKPGLMAANSGQTLLDLLQKCPGVMVDVEGNVSMRGKQGVMMMIDDKPLYIGGADLANYLRAIPSDAVAEIQIMSTPPARYDASGNAGIINILLIRNKEKGWSCGFTLSYGQGAYWRSNNSLNVSYRINKFNFYSQWSLGRNTSYQDLIIRRRYLDDAGALRSAFEQHTYIKTRNESNSARLGFDFYANKKITLGANASFVNSRTIVGSANNARVTDAADQLQSTVYALNPNDRKLNNLSYGAYLEWKPDTLGTRVNVNTDYLSYDGKMNQSLFNEINDVNAQSKSSNFISGNLPSTITILSSKADFYRPFTPTKSLSLGVKSSMVRTHNVADFRNEDGGVNNDFSNDFDYTENVSAAYGSYAYTKSSFSLQAGMRFEQTYIRGVQQGNAQQSDSSFTRKYGNLFPTLFMSYVFDTLGTHQLSWSIGRRIERPNYHDMNPFTYPMDRFTLYSGNPYLQPTFTYNSELTYTFKNATSITLVLSSTKNMNSETIEQRNGIFYSRPGNIGRQVGGGLNLYTSQNLSKWCIFQFYGEWMYNVYTGALYGQQLKNSGDYFYVEPGFQLPISQKCILEVSANYQSRLPVAQFVLIPVWSMRAGFTCRVMKQKGSLKLSVNDAWHSMRPGGDIQALQASTAGWKSVLDTRVVTLAFSYQLAKGKVLKAKNSSAVDSEKQRAN